MPAQSVEGMVKVEVLLERSRFSRSALGHTAMPYSPQSLWLGLRQIMGV